MKTLKTIARQRFQLVIGLRIFQNAPATEGGRGRNTQGDPNDHAIALRDVKDFASHNGTQ
jgi:hypothetical protein